VVRELRITRPHQAQINNHPTIGHIYMNAPQPPLPAGFSEIREGHARLIVRDDLAKAVRDALHPIATLWDRLSSENVMATGRGAVVAIPLGKDLPQLILRRYCHGGLLGKWMGDRYKSADRALMELSVTEQARVGGVAAPVMAGVIIIEHGFFVRMALMSEEIGGSEDLIHYCCRLGDYPRQTAAIEKRGVIREAARQIRLMHDLGIFHADLHLKNLLLRRRESGTPEVFIIDFDKAAKGDALTGQQRYNNLNRLARSVRKVHVAREVITAWDKVRFLREYLKGDDDAAKRLREWASKLAKAGKGREAWWAATGAKRNVLGDHVGQYRR
jgi:3-deoxy-D-manno-octulosonic acid kinase